MPVATEIPAWLTDATVVAAILVLAGTLVTQIMGLHNARMDRRARLEEKAADNRLARLTLVTDTMQEELSRLTSRVRDLEEKVRKAEQDLDESRRLYHAAIGYVHRLLAYIRDVLDRPVDDCASPPPVPPAPDAIAQDL